MEVCMTSMKDVAKQAGLDSTSLAISMALRTLSQRRNGRLKRPLRKRGSNQTTSRKDSGIKNPAYRFSVPESLSASFTDFVRLSLWIAEQNGYELIIRYVKDDPEVEKVVMLKLLRYQIERNNFHPGIGQK